jgi:hypothetical protein
MLLRSLFLSRLLVQEKDDIPTSEKRKRHAKRLAVIS